MRESVRRPAAHAGGPADAARSVAYDQRYGNDIADLAPRLSALMPPAADVAEVARAVAGIVDQPAGTRPFRTHIDPSRDGSDVVSTVADRIRAEFLGRVGLADLLTPGSSR